MTDLYGKIELICTTVMLCSYIWDVHSLNLKCITSNPEDFTVFIYVTRGMLGYCCQIDHSVSLF
jgi:hypothetical protein